MRILFDQGTLKPLREFLPGHLIRTAYQEQWNQLSNGALLAAAEKAAFDLLITTDQNLRHQQNLKNLKIAILILPTTNWAEIEIHSAAVARTIAEMKPGEIRELNWDQSDGGADL